MKRLSFVCILALAIGGCVTPTEGDRQLIHQSLGAGIFIAKTSDQPEVKKAGEDVAANSDVLQKNLGAPKVQQEYSSQASAAARKQATEEHADSWWMMLLKAAIPLGLGVIGGPWLLRFAPIIGKLLPFIHGPIATSLAEGYARAREAIQTSPDKRIDEATLLNLAVKSQEAAGVQSAVRGLAHSVEAKLAARL